jgi:WD40 repeat protein
MRQFHSIALLLLLFSALIFPSYSQEACALAPRLSIGNMGRVTPGDPNNLRAEPSRDSENIGSIPGGSSFIVLDGLTCADGLNWWQVNYNGLIGWTVEGADGTYWVEPYEAPCDLMIMLGQPAETLEERILYTEASPESEVLATIPAEALIEIGTDFHCEEYFGWVFASYEAQRGWISTVSNYEVPYGGVGAALEPRPVPLEPVANAASRLLPETPIEYNLASNAILPANVQSLALSQTLGEGQMTDFAWSPDGSKIAIATTLEARVYPADNFNAAPERFDGHDGNILAIRYSPDGRFLLTADGNGRLILRDANNLEEVNRVELEGNFGALTMSPDGSRLAIRIIHRDAHPMYWSIKILEFNPALETLDEIPIPSPSYPLGIQFTENPQKLVIVTNSSLLIWDSNELQEIEITNGFCCYIIAWAISPDHQEIVFFVEERWGDSSPGAIWYSLRVWNLESGTVIDDKTAVWTEYRSEPLYHSVRLFYGQGEAGYFLWALTDNQLNWVGFYSHANPLLPVNTSQTSGIIFNADRTLIAMGGLEGEIRLYPTRQWSEVQAQQVLYGLVGDVLDMQFSPDGSKLAARGSDHSLRVWDIETGQRQGSFVLIGAGAPFAVNSGQVLSSLRLWNGNTGQIAEQFNTGHGERLAAAFRPDGSPLYVSRDRETGFGTVWDARSGGILFEMDYQIWSDDISFSRDGQYLQIGLRVYNTSDFSLVNQLSAHFGGAYNFRFSPDNRLMLSFDSGLYYAEISPSFIIRDISTNDLLLNYAFEFTNINAVVWNNNGHELAWVYTAYAEGTPLTNMNIFNLESQSITASWEIESLYFGLPMLFSPDDSMLVLGNQDGMVYFYAADTGELLHSFQAHGGVVKQIAFSTDGSLLYTAGDDNTIRVWEAP